MKPTVSECVVCPSCSEVSDDPPALMWVMESCGCILEGGDDPEPVCVNAWECGKCGAVCAEKDEAKDCCR